MVDIFGDDIQMYIIYREISSNSLKFPIWPLVTPVPTMFILYV